MGGRSGRLACDLIGRIREVVSAGATRNRFAELLEASAVPRDRLTWLANEQFRIVGSDQRGFALLAARFPDRRPVRCSCPWRKVSCARCGLLADFAGALGWGERDLRAYEPRRWRKHTRRI